MKSLQLTPNAVWLIVGFLAYGVYKFLFFTTMGLLLVLAGILVAFTALYKKQRQ